MRISKRNYGIFTQWAITAIKISLKGGYKM